MAYPNYNPYQPYNQFPPMMQNGYSSPQPAVQPQSTFSCKPVTSREEALAMQTDFMAAGTIMPDLGHGVIYLKRFNPNTGSSDFVEFILKSNNETAEKFVSYEEYETFKKDVLSRMEAVGV